jgi:outer membrane protein assembly factor BamB
MKSKLSIAFSRSLVALSFAVALAAHTSAADRWPSWRGPNGDGKAATGAFPTAWKIDEANSESLLWHAKLPGRGASTPAVWDDHIFVTTSAEGKNWLLALDWSGKELWRTEMGEPRDGKHRNGTGSNPSPVTDGKYIAAYFKSGDIACTDTSGKVLWHHNLQKEMAEDTLWWDLGTSPVMTDDAIVVTVMQSGPSFLVAFDKATGKVLWKQDRNLDAPSEAAQSYSTPTLMSDKNGKRILVLGADHLTAHNAENGEMLWKVGGFNPTNHQYFRSISSPVLAGDFILCPYARGASLTAIRLGDSVSDEQRVAWKREDLGADVPTPTVVENRAYILADDGKVTCIDVATGKDVWSDSLPRNRAKYYSSPVYADGKLYLSREDGAVFVVAVGDKFELLASNQVPGETVATPVLVNGKILIRTFDDGFCFLPCRRPQPALG